MTIYVRGSYSPRDQGYEVSGQWIGEADLRPLFLTSADPGSAKFRLIRA